MGTVRPSALRCLGLPVCEGQTLNLVLPPVLLLQSLLNHYFTMLYCLIQALAAPPPPHTHTHVGTHTHTPVPL